MKRLFILICFLSISIGLYAQEGVRITAIVENVSNNEGNVKFALHTAETFLKTNGIQSLSSTIENGKAEVVFEKVPPGTYAILVLHDQNENNQMDFDLNGMPQESYGISNNTMSFGPPQFQDAQFEVAQENLSFQIRF